MAHQQLIIDLKTSQESATKAINEIHLKIEKAKDNKTKNLISYNAIHAIYMAIKDKANFFDIYADAIEKLVVDVSDVHWNSFIEILRFILNEFYTKNLFARANSLTRFIAVDRICTPADVKSHFKLFARHLLYSHLHLTPEQQKDTFKSLASIVGKAKEIQYEGLIEDFHSNILNYSTMVQQVIIKNLDKAAILFEKFFSFLISLKIDASKLNESFLLLTKCFIHFIAIDNADKNSVQSQNFLRAWKDNQSFKTHKYQSYALNLFYYFLKLLLFPNALDFNRNFVEIIEKFAIFFDRSELAKEIWFMDTIVTMVRVLHAFIDQNGFLKSLDEHSHYMAYNLIEKLIKLAHGVNYESGFWTCCNSVRKHIIFQLCNVQMTMLETSLGQEFKKPELGLSARTIFKHTISVAECFKCATVNAEAALMLNNLIRCAQNCKTKEHAELIANMLLLPIKIKDQLPQDSFRLILKHLLHVQKIAGNVQGLLETHALYIAYLMETNMDTNLIQKYIYSFYGLEPCMSVCETLDESKSPLKSANFNRRRLLHAMEIGVYSKTRGSNILVITSFLKSSTNTLDFVLVARQFPQVNVSKKLERKRLELKAKTTLAPLEHLVLGHICKLHACQQMDNIKNLFNIPKISDESLPQIGSDNGKLKQMDVIAEMEILKIGIEAIEQFQYFFEFACENVLPDRDLSIDWEAIVDDVAMLARLFQFRGYIDFAYRSWRLLLRITTHIDDILNRIRALAFMCEECQFVELYEPEFNIEKEIINIEAAITVCIDRDLQSLTPRRQNYVLILLCNMAWFYATKEQFLECQLLLSLARGKVNELEERKNKFELVRATLLATTFRIKWILQKEISRRTAFNLLDNILDEIRAVTYITSEDSVNFPILLFAMVNDISEFTTNRLCEPATLPYVQMVLKLALDSGAAFRTVQFLMMWTHINLQSEDAAKCQKKLDLIEIFYRNTLSSNTALAANTLSVTKNAFDINPADTQLIYDEQAVRKAAQINPISPVRIKHKATTVHKNLESFLISHNAKCDCEKCTHSFLKWQSFKIGCLNARLQCLGDVYTEPKSFYTKALEWCASAKHQKHTKFHFREYQFHMLIQYINLLRRTKNFDEAITTSESSIEIYNHFKNALDGVYYLNLNLQLQSTVIEKNRKAITPKSPKVRRILKFSPNEAAITLSTVTISKPEKRGRPKKESPPTLKEDIENLIYKDLKATTAAPQTSRKREKSAMRKEKTPVDDICQIMDTIQIDDEKAPKKTTTTTTTSRRKNVKQNLNTAIIIIDDDDDSPVPKSTSKSKTTTTVVESTPLTRERRRGRPKKPTAMEEVVVVMSEETDSRRRKPLSRRI